MSKSKQKIPNIIREEAELLRSVGMIYLPLFSKTVSSRVGKKVKDLPDSRKIKAFDSIIVPSLSPYEQTVRAIQKIALVKAKDETEKSFKTGLKLSDYRLAATKLRRVDDVINELKRAIKRLNSAETDKGRDAALIALDNASRKAENVLNDYVSTKQKNEIKSRSTIYVDVQKNDLLKAQSLSFQSAINALQDDEIEFELNSVAMKAIEGPMLKAGPDIQSSETVNIGIREAAEQYEIETGNQIVSYTYIAVDDEVTTDLCRELNGSTFDPNDPDYKKFTPPLHFNCRSYMAVNTSNMKDNPEITGAPKLSIKAQGQLQL